MTLRFQEHRNRSRWPYLLVALVVVAAIMALGGLWLLTGMTGPAADTASVASASLVAPTSTPWKPTATPSPSPAAPSARATETPAVRQPTISGLNADVNDGDRTIIFSLEAAVPPGRHIEEVLLWYDTETGEGLQRTAGPLPERIQLSYQLDARSEGLTRTLTTTRELDYWWLVRDSAGETARAGGMAILGPGLQGLVTAPAPKLPPAGFTWATSSTVHFQFYFVPGTAAERDLRQLGTLAEGSLARTGGLLGIDFDGQMSIYFVPRVFWQGGATYGDKVQLISYLDRNYTGVESWSYFAHEGTHALAQELLQPKENGGGPDGVLVEGLAVWASDGHYRQEPIDAWAAVVARTPDYIPLSELREGPFYDFQHETSYLEGASFVKFLIDRHGLGRLKLLYGLETGEAEHDETLIREIYGRGYEDLEAEWLDYLEGLSPTPEQAEMWRLKVRSFDLMRRYETELDPDARVLPPKPPPDWTTDTLRIFLRRLGAPANVALETALIEVQERMYGGDLEGADCLLDDIEAALDAGGASERPPLRARWAILDLIQRQDRAVLRGDPSAFVETLAPASPLARAENVERWLSIPLTSYHQELVRLQVSDDGKSARGRTLVRGQVAGRPFAEDGQLFSVTFALDGEKWLMLGRVPVEPVLPLPPPRKSSGGSPWQPEIEATVTASRYLQ